MIYLKIFFINPACFLKVNFGCRTQTVTHISYDMHAPMHLIFNVRRSNVIAIAATRARVLPERSSHGMLLVSWQFAVTQDHD